LSASKFNARSCGAAASGGLGVEIKGVPLRHLLSGKLPDQPESDNAMSWIVPPIIIPALFIVFIIA
jgi:hypothetical protein